MSPIPSLIESNDERKQRSGETSERGEKERQNDRRAIRWKERERIERERVVRGRCSGSRVRSGVESERRELGKRWRFRMVQL